VPRSKRTRVFAVALGLVAVVLSVQAPAVNAHAILVDSTPAQNSVIASPNPVIHLRVDGPRSRILLMCPDASVRQLSIDRQTSPEILTSGTSSLRPGDYRIHWQVLAVDGHISTGEILFTVRASSNSLRP
jgi:methionine-rich copper-binding protein CopC